MLDQNDIKNIAVTIITVIRFLLFIAVFDLCIAKATIAEFKIMSARLGSAIKILVKMLSMTSIGPLSRVSRSTIARAPK